MRILVVLSHPDPASFTHAVAAAFASGAQEGGHRVEIADLHGEGFDPRWRIEDAGQFERGGTVPPDILAEQARIERCDALCLVFPLYWFGMPAMLKGWMDRVFSWGWAYDQLDDPSRSLLRHRPCLALVPAAANPEDWRAEGFDQAMRAIWGKGTLDWFGMQAARIEFLGGVEGAPARRRAHLATARRLGQEFTR